MRKNRTPLTVNRVVAVSKALNEAMESAGLHGQADMSKVDDDQVAAVMVAGMNDLLDLILEDDQHLLDVVRAQGVTTGGLEAVLAGGDRMAPLSRLDARKVEDWVVATLHMIALGLYRRGYDFAARSCPERLAADAK